MSREDVIKNRVVYKTWLYTITTSVFPPEFDNEKRKEKKEN